MPKTEQVWPLATVHLLDILRSNFRPNLVKILIPGWPTIVRVAPESRRPSIG